MEREGVGMGKDAKPPLKIRYLKVPREKIKYRRLLLISLSLLPPTFLLNSIEEEGKRKGKGYKGDEGTKCFFGPY